MRVCEWILLYLEDHVELVIVLGEDGIAVLLLLVLVPLHAPDTYPSYVIYRKKPSNKIYELCNTLTTENKKFQGIYTVDTVLQVATISDKKTITVGAESIARQCFGSA